VSITFDPAIFATHRTIDLFGTGLEIGGNSSGIITIVGPAQGVTVGGAEIDSSPAIVMVDAGATVKMQGITLSDGVEIFEFGGGQGLHNEGSVSLDRCTLSNNEDSAIYNDGSLAVTNCAFFNNSNGSGADLTNGGSASFTNTTLSDPQPGSSVENSGKLRIADCTIHTDSPGQGAGLDNSGALTLSNSAADVAYGNITSLGHNFIGTADFSTGWVASDRTGTTDHPLDAKLSPLGNYGGPTQSIYPLPGSPLLKTGSAALVPAGITTDQRGFARLSQGKTDIGAVEIPNTSVVTVTPPSAQTAVAGVNEIVRLGAIADMGGSGPYTVTISWGDGSPDTSYAADKTGSISRNHAFISTGTLQGQVVVTDGIGDISAPTSFTVTSAAAAPKSIVVNSISDQTHPQTSSIVSLRDAIQRANASFGPVNISFDPATFASQQTIALTGSDLELTANQFGLITLTGPKSTVVIDAAQMQLSYGIFGDPLTRGVVTIGSGVRVNIANLGVSNGAVSGIFNQGNLRFASGKLFDMNALGASGIFNQGTMSLIDSTVTNNLGLRGVHRERSCGRIRRRHRERGNDGHPRLHRLGQQRNSIWRHQQ